MREVIAIAMSDRGCPPNLLLAPSDGPLLPGWSNAQIEEVCDLAEDVRNYCAHNAFATDFFSHDFSGLWGGNNRKKYGVFLTRTQELAEAIQLLIVERAAE